MLGWIGPQLTEFWFNWGTLTMYLKSSPSHFAQFSLTMGCYTSCSMVRVATCSLIVVAKKSFGNFIRDKSGTSRVPITLVVLYFLFYYKLCTIRVVEYPMLDRSTIPRLIVVILYQANEMYLSWTKYVNFLNCKW